MPRLVDVLPNGPVGHPTIRLFLAGGVPEVMLHLRSLGLLRLDALTAAGERLGDVLEWWERSDRRHALAGIAQRARRRRRRRRDHVARPGARAADSPARSPFRRGNIAPEGSVIKSTSIDPSVVDADGVYRKVGPARVFTSEREAVAAIKGRSERKIQPGDVIVLICRGPLGAGMEEIYQITSALRYLKWGKEVAVITDARFSGVSTGACIGHVGPEALAGGPIGKLRDGDLIEIVIDRNRLTGSINFVGTASRGSRPTKARPCWRNARRQFALHSDPDLPADTRLWALLQQASGGTWGGCVYDVDAIERRLRGARAEG